ncbi:carbohydrate ABC transporter permease [Muricomes sp. OA1]|uniref:Carbohydrate ABC transporter permease n=1 Tax=Hungatella hathewayi TaxID=154046 RepID=A0A3E2X125_9FIRM|nr:MULTISPECIES: carbohydrate ABC transporter permease [Clostridia]MCH1975001.1 carbohydrate ABC transporter permease [Muricomes sp. OA1]MRM89855.1 carbohydrate ABC transporter permease [Faecalicatena contorta]RGC34021.1 carbohydrate ABC transporter permease [Hungatella hathewayi]GKH33831.1 sugar ABC transporter ATP-binding protein [Faecalicatena contorta]
MKKLTSSLSYVILAIISFISLFPFYMMITMSTYKTEQIFQSMPFLPSDYFGKNIATVFQSNFLQSYGNSLFISVVSMAVCVLVSAMVGYAMLVYDFKFKKALMNFIMLTMMVPTQIGIIGYMIEMRTLHLTGTLWPMILLWFANGFGAFWMIQFINGSMPMEIVESARIDGAGELKIFFGMVFPCIRPGVLTLCLLIFLWSWNSYLVPLVFVNNESLNTIPIFIKSLANAYRTDYGAQLSGLLLATIPLLIMFICGSKSFIKGLTAGAVKG